MLNKNLALIALVVFAAGCGMETRTYVMTKDRVGLDQVKVMAVVLSENALRQLRKKLPARFMCWN